MTATDASADLLAAARAWRDDDPDATTRGELDSLIGGLEAGSDQARNELADRFSGMLEFGTAGLRGALGAGPNRMNRSVVIRAAAGLTPTSRTRAMRVTTPSSSSASTPATTPTSSPATPRRSSSPQAGARCCCPSRCRRRCSPSRSATSAPTQESWSPRATTRPRTTGTRSTSATAARSCRRRTSRSPPTSPLFLRWRAFPSPPTGGRPSARAWSRTTSTRSSPSSLPTRPVTSTACTPVCTVSGTALSRRRSSRRGSSYPPRSTSKPCPDPDFPTVAFPNPEEKGAIDLALDQARARRCDLVIANDPDADRCAAAVLDPALGDWRMLRGDEVGALLGAHIVNRGVQRGDVFASSIVSSRLLAAIAAAAGIRHEETLTGFKWISRVDGLRYGYEEALGYCVAPHIVRDKDGVSAALLLAELAATLKAEGRHLTDLLDDLAIAHGVHATDSFSVRVSDLTETEAVMRQLREAPPTSVADIAVTRVDDLSAGDGGLPPTEGLRYYLADESRVIVRPSGTEPKVKVYLEVIEAVPAAGDLAAARAAAADRLAAIRAEFERLTALP